MTMGLALLSTAALAETSRTIAFSVKTVTNDDFQKAIATSIQDAVEKSGNKFLLVTAGEEGNEGLYISYVGTDNFNAGKTAGERMVKELGGKGNVLIVRGANGSLAGDLRVDGFKAGIQGSGLVVAGEQPGNWTNSVAMQVTENMLQANKNVDGLFSASDVMLDGVLQAAGDANRTGIKILSVDGSKKAVDLVEQGAIVGTMAQFPGKMGPIGVENLLAVLGGKKAADSIPKVIDSGTMVYDKSNLAEACKWAF